jgi:hypothetical protein
MAISRKPAAIFAILAILVTGFLRPAQAQVPVFEGDKALADIARQLEFGPRSPGKPGHDREIALLRGAFQTLQVPVTVQSWSEPAPDGHPLHLSNIIAHLGAKDGPHMIAATHYDSIVRAYADKTYPNAPMPGANNSASGVALLLEAARLLQAAKVQPRTGVDMIFFDGEEGPLSLGAGDPAWRALGSPHFAQHIAEVYPGVLPTNAVVFDMVCYRAAKFYPERFSLKAAPQEVETFWTLGMSLDPKIFSPERAPSPIGDDQVALSDAGIPSLLVIAFDYAPWFNTTQDTIDKCSSETLRAVGQTLMNYIYAQ